jgi:hypothetical protein
VQDTIAEIHHFAIHSYEWVLEADIKACSDEIDHTALMGRIRASVPFAGYGCAPVRYRRVLGKGRGRDRERVGRHERGHRDVRPGQAGEVQQDLL